MNALAICQGAARIAIGHLVQANALDEQLHTWDTVRLAAHAVQTLEMIEIDDPDTVTLEDLIDTLYDALALIRAAFSTRMDVVSAARRSLLESAYDAVYAAAGEIAPDRKTTDPAPQASDNENRYTAEDVRETIRFVARWEREQCAKACEDRARAYRTTRAPGWQEVDHECTQCAAAIRGRDT